MSSTATLTPRITEPVVIDLPEYTAEDVAVYILASAEKGAFMHFMNLHGTPPPDRTAHDFRLTYLMLIGRAEEAFMRRPQALLADRLDDVSRRVSEWVGNQQLVRQWELEEGWVAA